MHELAVTESLLEIALRHAETAGATRVTDLFLVVGQLSSIVDDSVSFYWDMISEGTIAEGAKMHFRRMKTEMQCQDCETKYSPTDRELACPDCGSQKVRVVSGDAFYLEAIEVETPEDNKEIGDQAES
jgi:hydrogenase nickel incorporation protein HypA/HybF